MNPTLSPPPKADSTRKKKFVRFTGKTVPRIKITDEEIEKRMKILEDFFESEDAKNASTE